MFERAGEASLVVPIHPFSGRDLDIGDTGPGSVFTDQICFVQ